MFRPSPLRPSSRHLSLVLGLVATLAVLAPFGESSANAAERSTDTARVDTDLFLDGALADEPTTEACTLSGGAATTCYRLTVSGYPTDHEIGPFCPSTITDGADKGGIWFDGNAVYDLTGAFIKGLAQTYGDDRWRLYDDNGKVIVTDTQAAFEGAAQPNVAAEYQNHCVEGRLEWLENGEPITTTVLIPATPVAASSSAVPQGNQGVTLDGVVIAASAPVSAILGAYTIAAFDDCGGHFNPHEGYHLHGAVGCSEVGDAAAGDTPMFGYALDGYPVHSPFTDAELADVELDECNGHTTAADGYHYHANSAKENQVIACLKGQTVATRVGPPTPPVTPTAQDTTAPDTLITGKPKRRGGKRRVRFAFGATESDVTYRCKVDGRRYKACASPKKMTLKRGRRHVFRVRATDAAGNRDQTPAKYSFRIRRP